MKKALPTTLHHILYLACKLCNIPKLRNVEKMCVLIGCPRSGTTLLEALINAHAQIVISHEFNLLDLLMQPKLANPFKRRVVYAELLMEALKINSENLNKGPGFSIFDYEYNIPKGHQNQNKNPIIIGDKSVAPVAQLFHKHGAAAIEAAGRFDFPMHFVHIIRNPYDCITTFYTRYQSYTREDLSLYRKPISLLDNNAPLGRLFEQAETDLLSYQICRYFAITEGLATLRNCMLWPVLDVHYKTLTQQPRQELTRIINWLGLETDNDYLDACETLVKPASRTRERIGTLWTEEKKAIVAKQIERFDFLHQYNWNN